MNIGLDLLPAQREIIRSRSSQRLFLSGVGGGKTHALCAQAMLNALTMPSVNGAIFCPTFTLLRRVVLPVWQRVCPMDLYDWREDRQEIIMRNGVVIYCLSTKRLEYVVGLNLGWVLMDEAGSEKKGEIVGLLMARIRAGDANVNRHLGIFTSPHGHGWLKEWSERTLDDGAPAVHVVRSTTYSNPYLPEDYVRNLEIEYPVGSRLHRQEMLGEFVFQTGLIYGDIFSKSSHTVDWHGDSSGEYVLSVDPGYRASAWLVWQKNAKDRNQWVVVDEYLPEDELTEVTARQILRERGRPPAQVYCDTPSKQNSRTHINDVDAMRDVFGQRARIHIVAGYQRATDYRHKAVIAGLSSGRLRISTQLTISRATSTERGLVHSLESAEWPAETTRDERRDPSSRLWHVLDALEFGAAVLTPPKMARSQDRMAQMDRVA